LPGSIHFSIQSAIRKNWQVSLFIIGLSQVSWPKFHAMFGNRIELIFNSRSSALFNLLKIRKGYFDLIGAIGPQSSAALQKLRNTDPDCLAGAEIFSGTEASKLEQIVEMLPDNKTTQG
jgi:hypothetical protein